MTRLPRYTRLSRGGPIKASSKPMAKRGATKAKKEARYKAYLSSAAWKRKRAACIEAAGGRCENIRPATHIAFLDGFPLSVVARCDATEYLTAHHLTYARFGKELPSDLMCLCRTCHNALEGLKGRRVS